MIHIQHASLSFGTQNIFDDISLTLSAHQRIGVLGRNGTGKSTLLKIIAGQGHFDDGTLSIDRHKVIAYMPQEITLFSTKTVIDEVLSVFVDLFTKDAERQAIEKELEREPHNALLIERYWELSENSSSFDAASARAKAEKILKGLGFSSEAFTKPVSELSEGWKMRLVLAKLLVKPADFYLFDEPTNHLDLPTKEWFFDFLRQGRFGFLLVSHDRHFLEAACDHILGLEHGQARLFNGNLSAYIKAQEHERVLLEAAYEKQQKDIARKEATIARFRASATKAKMAQSMIKQLDKIERITIEPVLPTVSFSFPEVERAGATVLTMNGIQQHFNERLLFSNVTGTVGRGERVALVAPNGTGKTTLFNILTGKLPAQTGSVTYGHNVHYAVFEQDQMRALNPQNTLYEEVLQAAPGVTESQIRTMLGCFLFSGDTINKKIKVLSGGERNRVAMVKVLLQKANLLLLDEPTNHLDLYSKDILLQALKAYKGTLLFVSHDHTFIQDLATTIWELTPQGIQRYPTDYESYLGWKKSLETEQAQEKALAENKHVERSSKQHYLARKEIASLETKIDRVEREITALQDAFAGCDYNSTKWQNLEAKLAAAKLQYATLYAQWERLLETLGV